MTATGEKLLKYALSSDQFLAGEFKSGEFAHVWGKVNGRSHGDSGQSDGTGPNDVDVAGFLGDTEAVAESSAIVEEDLLPVKVDRLGDSLCFKFSLMLGGSRQL